MARLIVAGLLLWFSATVALAVPARDGGGGNGAGTSPTSISATVTTTAAGKVFVWVFGNGTGLTLTNTMGLSFSSRASVGTTYVTTEYVADSAGAVSGTVTVTQTGTVGTLLTVHWMGVKDVAGYALAPSPTTATGATTCAVPYPQSDGLLLVSLVPGVSNPGASFGMTSNASLSYLLTEYASTYGAVPFLVATSVGDMICDGLYQPATSVVSNGVETTKVEGYVIGNAGVADGVGATKVEGYAVSGYGTGGGVASAKVGGYSLSGYGNGGGVATTKVLGYLIRERPPYTAGLMFPGMP